MNIVKAEKIATLVNEIKRYEAILNFMKIGFSDEWGIINTHTKENVELSVNDWQALKAFFADKQNELTKELDEVL